MIPFTDNTIHAAGFQGTRLAGYVLRTGLLFLSCTKNVSLLTRVRRSASLLLAAALLTIQAGQAAGQLQEEARGWKMIVSEAASTDVPAPQEYDQGVIEGRVTTPDGSAISNVRVYALDVNCGEPSWGARSVTDTAGNYAITRIPPGTYYVLTDAHYANPDPFGYFIDEYWNGCTGSPYCKYAQPVTVKENQVVSFIDFVLDTGGRIRGTVSAPDGSPVEGACMYAYTEPCENRFYLDLAVAETVTDADGVYTVTGVPGGDVYVSAGFCSDNESEPYLLTSYWASDNDTADCREAGAVAVVEEKTLTGVAITLVEGGRIGGVITQTDGTPVEHACVILNKTACEEGDGVAAGFETGPDGTYGGVVTPGVYYARTVSDCTDDIPETLYVDTYWDNETGTLSCDQARAITITAGEDTEPVDFVLERGGRIEGTVTAEFGFPAPDVCMAAQTEQCGGGGVYGETDAEGRFVIYDVPSGSIYLSADASCDDADSGSLYIKEHWTDDGNTSDCREATPIALEEGQALSGYRFRLEKGGRIRGAVTDADGRPIAGLVILIRDDQCLEGEIVGPRLETGSDGSFASIVLSEGSYYVNTFADGSDAIPFGVYEDEYWDGAEGTINCQQAVPVSTLAGQDTGNIDFVLDFADDAPEVSTTTTAYPTTTTSVAADDPECMVDADCEDGLFCNGAEVCDNGTCVCGGTPCSSDEVCMEELQACWEYRKAATDTIARYLRTPLFLPRRCTWLVMRNSDRLSFDAEESTIELRPAKSDYEGVMLDVRRSAFRAGDFVFVPVCVEHGATTGPWTVIIVTDHPGEERPLRYIFHGNFSVKTIEIVPQYEQEY